MLNAVISVVRLFQGFRTPVFSAWGRIYLRALGVKHGRGLSASSSFLCRRHGTGILTIGENLRLTNRSTENRAGINHKCILIVEDGATMTIGDNVGMSGATLYCAVGVHIEDYVNIGANVALFDTDFHAIGWRERRAHDRGAVKRSPILIRHDAWIGANAIILKGVTVGRRAIVGAGAVVTHDVPDDTIVAGSPARPVAILARTIGGLAQEGLSTVDILERTAL